MRDEDRQDADLRALRKQVSRLERVVSEHAQALHDLAEERLPGAYRELPEIAEATVRACAAWEAAERALREAAG